MFVIATMISYFASHHEPTKYKAIARQHRIAMRRLRKDSKDAKIAESRRANWQRTIFLHYGETGK
ncbi:MAG: hypothetical protein U5Q03_17535 [Bacteroidota bacterium]|nr:hypothetical protein [Bacteroidota bacterium]